MIRLILGGLFCLAHAGSVYCQISKIETSDLPSTVDELTTSQEAFFKQFDGVPCMEVTFSEDSFEKGMPEDFGLNDSTLEDFRGTIRSRLVFGGNRLYLDGAMPASKQKSIVKYDGRSSWVLTYDLPDKPISIDIWCERPLIFGSAFGFVRVVSCDCARSIGANLASSDLISYYRDFEFLESTNHTDHGEVEVFHREEALPNGISRLRLFFGERFGKIVLVATEKADISNPMTYLPTDPGNRSVSRVVNSYKYEVRANMVIPVEWTRKNTSQVVAKDMTPVGTIVVDRDSVCRVEKFRIFESFPAELLDRKAPSGVQVYDHCKDQEAAVLPSNGSRWLWAAGIACAILIILAIVYRKKFAQ